MAVLNRSDRTQLKNSVLAAREIAEEAAERAINVFAVSESNAPDYLTEEQFHSMDADCSSLFALLTASIKTAKK